MHTSSSIMTESSPTHLAFLQSDIVGSSLIQKEFGDAVQAEVIERVGRIYSECSRAFDGDYIDNAGDAPYGSFKTARDAVRCALLFQDKIKEETWPHRHPVEIRIGIHFGVITCSIEDSASGRRKPSGEAVTVARRLVDLKTHGRIMISQVAVAMVGYEKDDPWLTWEHGRYGWQGGPTTYDQVVTPEASQEIRLKHPKLEVCEITRAGDKPLIPSPSNQSACWPVDENWNRRDTEPTQLIQVGMKVPGRENWIIEKCLGEGGFGQAWLARNSSLSAPDYLVYKFCKNPARFRSFEREEGIGGYLQTFLPEIEKAQQLEKSGMNGIVPVRDFNQQAPLWIATPHYAHGSLVDWALANDGKNLANLEQEERIRFVIELAGILGRVHEVGVVHKDIKPANIFIHQDQHGIHPVIADFGISCVIDKERRQRFDMPGRQHTISSPISTLGTLRSGTDMYMPPEYQQAGAKPTVKGDLYALGVLLYQLLISDFNQPFESAQECKRRLPDSNKKGEHLHPFIREAIFKALDAEKHRFPSAEAFAKQLTELQQDYENDEATKAKKEAARQARLREEAEHVASLERDVARNARLAQTEAEQKILAEQRAAINARRIAKAWRWGMGLASAAVVVFVCLTFWAQHQEEIAKQERDKTEQERLFAEEFIDGVIAKLFRVVERVNTINAGVTVRAEEAMRLMDQVLDHERESRFPLEHTSFDRLRSHAFRLRQVLLLHSLATQNDRLVHFREGIEKSDLCERMLRLTRHLSNIDPTGEAAKAHAEALFQACITLSLSGKNLQFVKDSSELKKWIKEGLELALNITSSNFNSEFWLRYLANFMAIQNFFISEGGNSALPIFSLKAFTIGAQFNTAEGSLIEALDAYLKAEALEVPPWHRMAVSSPYDNITPALSWNMSAAEKTMDYLHQYEAIISAEVLHLALNKPWLKRHPDRNEIMRRAARDLLVHANINSRNVSFASQLPSSYAEVLALFNERRIPFKAANLPALNKMDPRIQQIWMSAHHRIGHSFSSAGRHAEALKAFEEAFKVCSKWDSLASTHDKITPAHWMAKLEIDLGNAKAKLKQAPEESPMIHYASAIERFDELASQHRLKRQQFLKWKTEAILSVIIFRNESLPCIWFTADDAYVGQYLAAYHELRGVADTTQREALDSHHAKFMSLVIATKLAAGLKGHEDEWYDILLDAYNQQWKRYSERRIDEESSFFTDIGRVRLVMALIQLKQALNLEKGSSKADDFVKAADQAIWDFRYFLNLALRTEPSEEVFAFRLFGVTQACNKLLPQGRVNSVKHHCGSCVYDLNEFKELMIGSAKCKEALATIFETWQEANTASSSEENDPGAPNYERDKHVDLLRELWQLDRENNAVYFMSALQEDARASLPKALSGDAEALRLLRTNVAEQLTVGIFIGATDLAGDGGVFLSDLALFEAHVEKLSGNLLSAVERYLKAASIIQEVTATNSISPERLAEVELKEYQYAYETARSAVRAGVDLDGFIHASSILDLWASRAKTFETQFPTNPVVLKPCCLALIQSWEVAIHFGNRVSAGRCEKWVNDLFVKMGAVKPDSPDHPWFQVWTEESKRLSLKSPKEFTISQSSALPPTLRSPTATNSTQLAMLGQKVEEARLEHERQPNSINRINLCRAMVNQGFAFVGANKMRESLDIAEKTLSLDSVAQAYLIRAVSQLGLGKHAEAMAYLRAHANDIVGGQLLADSALNLFFNARLSGADAQIFEQASAELLELTTLPRRAYTLQRIESAKREVIKNSQGAGESKKNNFLAADFFSHDLMNAYLDASIAALYLERWKEAKDLSIKAYAMAQGGGDITVLTRSQAAGGIASVFLGEKKEAVDLLNNVWNSETTTGPYSNYIINQIYLLSQMGLTHPDMHKVIEEVQKKVSTKSNDVPASSPP